MSDSRKQRKKGPVRLTNEQIRDHLEATSLHGPYASQANIDLARRFMEEKIRTTRKP